MKDGFLTTNYMIFFSSKTAWKLCPDGSYSKRANFDKALKQYRKEAAI
jgi:hypothetical protein